MFTIVTNENLLKSLTERTYKYVLKPLMACLHLFDTTYLLQITCKHNELSATLGSSLKSTQLHPKLASFW